MIRSPIGEVRLSLYSLKQSADNLGRPLSSIGGEGIQTMDGGRGGAVGD
jgi:hypothetical protein